MKFTIDSPKLGQHEVLIDDEDYAKLKGWTWYLWSSPRHYGIYVNGYSPEDRRNPKRIHRIIMNAMPGQIVDHINGNPLDNRKSNLRLTTSQVNNENARKRKDGVTSKFKGVCWYQYTNRWRVQVQHCGIKKALGYFTCEEEAAKAYDKALDQLGKAGPRNFPKENI